jgi:hypothetical protein
MKIYRENNLVKLNESKRVYAKINRSSIKIRRKRNYEDNKEYFIRDDKNFFLYDFVIKDLKIIPIIGSV